MKIYGIKNCDTVRKARKFLETHNIDFEFIDFRDEPLDEATLQSFVDVIGWENLINKRSTTYRNLTDLQKTNITLALTLKNPTLIKRPVLVTDTNIRVGFSEKSYADLI
jgi:arsenate reductase